MVLYQTTAENKGILLKAYTEQWQLEKAIGIILENRSVDTQVSLLGKLDDSYSEDSPRQLQNIENVKNYWKRLLGKTADFGYFSNPEVGTIFTVGPLVGTFLHDVEGTKLAELSAGPDGILRGLGVASDHTIAHIKSLIEGDFILILRGYGRDLKKLEDELMSMELLSNRLK
jgi:hypothetical protein